MLNALHNPRNAGVFTYGRHREQLPPGGKRASITVPRQEWTSFIPGAHPGYVRARALLAFSRGTMLISCSAAATVSRAGDLSEVAEEHTPATFGRGRARIPQ